MSILVIGGDKISRLKDILAILGATKTRHWDSRNKTATFKKLPHGTDMIIMLTDFLNHNSMYHFKNDAKKTSVPLLCVKGLGGCNECQIKKMMDDIREYKCTNHVCNVTRK